MEAASAARTVSLTDCIKFWALITNCCIASSSSDEPEIDIINSTPCDKTKLEMTLVMSFSIKLYFPINENVTDYES